MSPLPGALRNAARSIARRVRRFRMRYGLPGARIVFDPRYALPVTHIADGRRAEKILGHLQREHVLDPTSVLKPTALHMRDVIRVHEVEYLASLDRPEALEQIFPGARDRGFDPVRVLDAHRWATAGTVHAAVTALRYPWLKSPVVNLGGGFHHARRDKGSGFCAINDVAIAIDRVRAQGFSGTILIVDLDYHQGDGTRRIFADDPTVTTCSIHAQQIDDSPAVATLDVELGPAVGDQTYASALDATLVEAFERSRPQLVFYVAGADVAGTDALANWRVSAEGVALRDRKVLERSAGIPTVVVLAGGYGAEAWRYPARMLTWLLTAEDSPIPTSEERALAGFRAIRKSLSNVALRNDPSADSDDELTITEADLYGDLLEKTRDKRFLGFYSTFGLEVAFERYGLAEHLRGRGYDGFVIDPDSRVGAVGEGVRVWADATRSEVLIELVMSELYAGPGSRLLSIEWLLLQDPRATKGQHLLPGQKHPGLGCLRIVVGMLVMACERLGYDGLTLVPAHYHVAAIARRIFGFLDPVDEAYFLALATATKHMSVAEASMTIAARKLVHKGTREVAPYRPSRMVLAVSAALREHLEGAAYAHTVEAEANRLDLVVQ